MLLVTSFLQFTILAVPSFQKQKQLLQHTHTHTHNPRYLNHHCNKSSRPTRFIWIHYFQTTASGWTASALDSIKPIKYSFWRSSGHQPCCQCSDGDHADTGLIQSFWWRSRPLSNIFVVIVVDVLLFVFAVAAVVVVVVPCWWRPLLIMHSPFGFHV